MKSNERSEEKAGRMVTIRFTEGQVVRFSALTAHLGLPVRVPLTQLIRTCAIAGLVSFERKHYK